MTNSNSEAITDSEAVETNIPKLLQHCIDLYKLMDKNGKEVSDGKIYVGSLTQDFNSLDVSPSHYSAVVNKLRAMGCVEMLKRGGGPRPSTWILYKPPTFELFLVADDTGEKKYQTNAEKEDALEQRIRDLTTIFNNLTTRLEKIEDWAREHGAPI